MRLQFISPERIYIWVPGTEQPEELLYFNNGPQHPAGRDYAFDTRQQAFDASDILRRCKLPYDMEITPAGRIPWLTGPIFSDCFGPI